MALHAGRPAGKALAGQWVVLDAGGLLLSIGDKAYSGQSPRNYLDLPGRNCLLPLLLKVAGEGAPDREIHSLHGEKWTVEAIPVLGPSGCVHAVMGYYVAAFEHSPEWPVVAAWEWDVSSMRVRWTPEMYRFYGLADPSVDDKGFWDVPEWFGLLEPSSYGKMREFLASLHASRGRAPVVQTYRIIRADTGASSTLRTVGRTVLDQSGQPHWYRGITTLSNHYQAGPEEEFNRQQLIQAGQAMIICPLLVTDAHDDRVFLNVGAPWSAIGVAAEANAPLYSLVHPDDADALRGFLDAAPSTPVRRVPVMRARFPTERGWKSVEVGVVRFLLRVTGAEVEQLMVRFGPS
jgi:hypothetical protein